MKVIGQTDERSSSMVTGNRHFVAHIEDVDGQMSTDRLLVKDKVETIGGLINLCTQIDRMKERRCHDTVQNIRHYLK